MFSSNIWLSGFLTVASSISSIVLSIQRGVSHNKPLYLDTKRDPTDPFADTHRLTRLICSTLILTGLAFFYLIHQLQQQHNDFIATLSSVCAALSWFYVLSLTFMSTRYRLPDPWGWKLNVHLFSIYLAAFIVAIVTAFEQIIVGQPNMPWLLAFPHLLSVLLTMDLVYVTITVKQGSRYLDDQHVRIVCGENVSSIWETIFFSYATPIFTEISQKKGDFTDADLPILTMPYRAGHIFYDFCVANDDQKKSLFRRLLFANRASLMIQVVLAVVASLLYYLPTFLLNRMLQFLQDLSQGTVVEYVELKGTLLVIGIGLSIMTMGVANAQLFYYASCSLQTKIRTMLSVEIYRKSLRRRDLSSAEKDTTTGSIVNLMSTDATRVSEFSSLWFSSIGAPVELAIGSYFLYQLIGIASLLGLLVMVLVLPINHLNSKIFAKTQDRLMQARDKRVSLMSELLQGIRQIKFFAWEKKWEERIMDARKVELKHLGITYINSIFFSFVWQGVPVLVTLVCFYSFTKIQGNQLTAPIAFTVIGLFAELRYALNALPETFIQGIQAYNSLKRIEKFLQEEEIKPPQQVGYINQDIGFKKATLGWSQEEDGFILKDIDATFPLHQLSLISGATGSGKTLMLLSLLGEACVLQGQAYCPRVHIADTLVASQNITSDEIARQGWVLEHSLAYVSQSPWLQNASIRDNILFGLPFVPERYYTTLTACALDKDLTILEDDDQTEIGEKGITLSGGQKARVALARAVYSRASIIVMDDCLSAVDAHTAKHLYTQCLMGPLMAGRTRILVTHHVKLYLGGCAYLIHVKNGRTEFVGSPMELKQTGHLDEVLADDQDDEEEQKAADTLYIESLPSSSTSIQEPIINEEKKKPRALIGKETRSSGSIKFSLYKIYFGLVGNYFYWFIMALIILCARSLEIGENWWIKKWAESYNVHTNVTLSSETTMIETHSQPKLLNQELYHGDASIDMFSSGQHVFSTPSTDDNLNFYLGIYSLIAFANVIVGCSRYIFIYYGSLGANRQLYASLVQRILRAPLRFFDTTPMGRILNRFSKDFESIDSHVPTELINFIIHWFTIFTTAVIICVVIPGLILPVIMVALLDIYIGARFVNSSRELKRLESTTRSPVFSCFTETVAGISTIRAYGATQQCLQVMLDNIDANMRPFMLTWLSNRWVSMRNLSTAACINVFAFAVVFANRDRIDVALAGFTLSYVVMFTENLHAGVRQYTAVEMAFNSVERAVEFTELEQEPPAVTIIRPPPKWPTEGKIQVKDLQVRYAPDLEPVIRGISFDVKAQEKVGIVGRTGSGKSTLALSFFRFVEASAGSICIDGIDIHDIGTEDLRSNLTIIPQDPTLFSGTLRSNMDPFDEFSDADIFLALRRAHLIPSDEDPDNMINSNVFKSLDSTVSEGGKNFSQGQRQLLCLARALLKRSQVVFMDEATASVDFETDKAIQKTISTEFKVSSIICIAHRLLTIIEYDRVLVLDHGRILEYENPLTLLKNPKSSFYEMCQKSGEFDILLELAKAKHNLIDTEF